ncbi:RDD family protein [Streptomyces sp. HSW2009]|uniref:RDD family protein n=1 Tax=Streptomyces sp. HSW2009 TaxID=3142890 RepID=UPI0032ECB435
MDNRQVLGSWLSGPRATAEQMGVDFGYRGERLGLPREGRGAIAPPGRRMLALLVDWALCMLIAYALLADRNATSAGNWALPVFLVMSALTVGTLGCTPGKMLLRIRVVGIDGNRLSLPRTLLRCVLLGVVIPAVIWDRDSRGLHDRIAGAVQIRI